VGVSTNQEKEEDTEEKVEADIEADIEEAADDAVAVAEVAIIPTDEMITAADDIPVAVGTTTETIATAAAEEVIEEEGEATEEAEAEAATTATVEVTEEEGEAAIVDPANRPIDSAPKPKASIRSTQ